MKVVILAGGKGTRISEESKLRPKPMVKIGGRPILWHIMKHYSHYGFHDFIVCCGYKGFMIKEYFVKYYMNNSKIEFHLRRGQVDVIQRETEPWKVTLVDTGLETLTAGRILKVRDYIGEEPFMLTYGDGVSDIDINKLLEFHKTQGKLLTISTTRPEGRFGALKIDEETSQVKGFKEKARNDQAWVNMGFMVMEPKIYDYFGNGDCMLEAAPFEALAGAGEMGAYRHEGFWSPMDTIRDRDYLNGLWSRGEAPWAHSPKDAERLCKEG